MDIQEGIKLQTYRLFCQHCQALQKVMGWKGKPCWVIQYNEPEAICASAIDAADGLFALLRSEGLVRKVEGELPSNFYKTDDEQLHQAFEYGQRDMLEAGYCKVEEI